MPTWRSNAIPPIVLTFSANSAFLTKIVPVKPRAFKPTPPQSAARRGIIARDRRGGFLGAGNTLSNGGRARSRFGSAFPIAYPPASGRSGCACVAGNSPTVGPN
eukprot:GEMP01106842.1.p2 GENE.GEMP01106842.1~~GEMP01106842.1.p2  ORF type:complete len:104 (-),score=10.36 GEMP01106842.1:6-317(-)